MAESFFQRWHDLLAVNTVLPSFRYYDGRMVAKAMTKIRNKRLFVDVNKTDSVVHMDSVIASVTDLRIRDDVFQAWVTPMADIEWDMDYLEKFKLSVVGVGELIIGDNINGKSATRITEYELVKLTLCPLEENVHEHVRLDKLTIKWENYG